MQWIDLYNRRRTRVEVKEPRPISRIIRNSMILACMAACCAAAAQTTAAQTTGIADAGSPYAGRIVRDVRIIGNAQVSPAIIRNVIRTRVGEPYDPATVREDYQRIFELRRFSTVEAKYELTDDGGVIVVFEVTEQPQVREIRFVGNRKIPDETLEQYVDVHVGEAIDDFRIAMSRQAIEDLYRDRNFAFAHVTVDPKELGEHGNVVFHITEGPNVRIRKVNFIGRRSFTEQRLRGQVRSLNWIPVFRAGTFDPEQIADDVASLQRFYTSKGFFDARIGRKLIFSPDLSEIQIDFLIDEGRRYVIDRVSFKGNRTLSDEQLRAALRLGPGRPYDADLVTRDIREMVRAYSPFGFIYQPDARSPEYLDINPRTVFRQEAGKVDLVYEISEGKPFRLGQIHVKGNSRTQDKVVLRELRVAPGQLYDSGALQDAAERLRGTPYFTGVTMTPIGDDPDVRDLLVEVSEAKTATFNIGAGVNSNGGLGANITYEQRNFDIAAWPQDFGEFFSDRALVGAGQQFRATFEPGTEQTNASMRFFEPYLFDQPYNFGAEAYLRDRRRDDFDETRAGGRLTFGKRFDYIHSASISLRAEDVKIHDIDFYNEFLDGQSIRAPDINDAKGHSTLTSVGLQLRRDTTNRGVLPAKGTTTTFGWESFGALGGDAQFQKVSASWDAFITLGEDLLERKTILNLHADAGYLFNDAPFFERYYGGGIGNVRGFQFRGISPRGGLAEDAIGGDFTLAATAEIGFPLAGDSFRGVVFTDAGTVEEDFEITRIRSSVGAGIRLIIPMLGQAPLAIDFAYPLSRKDEDDTQVISFSFGIMN
jgi:outer membrane protein insertion porin family